MTLSYEDEHSLQAKTNMPLSSTSGNANFRPSVWEDGDMGDGTGAAAVDAPSLPTFLAPKCYVHQVEKTDALGDKYYTVSPTPGALPEYEGNKRTYEDYLNRSRKDIGKDGKQVWSVEMENAFQYAIRKIPPVLGKKKVEMRTPNGSVKHCGRNEVIAHVVAKLTGGARDRKQISSHIQVLNSMFRNAVKYPKRAVVDADDEIFKYTHTDPKTVKALNGVRFKFDEEHLTLIPSEDISARLATLPAHIFRAERAHLPSSQTKHTLGPTIQAFSPSHQAFNFTMKIVTKRGERSTLYSRNEHVCTSVQSIRGAQPRVLEDVAGWRQFFPELEGMLTDESSRGCKLFYMESSIALALDRLRDNMAVEIRCAIDLSCDRACRNWELQSTVYEDIGKKGYKFEKQEIHIDPMRSTRTKTRLVHFPFHSSWWVMLFQKANLKYRAVRDEFQRELEESGHSDCLCDDCRPLRDEMQKAMDDEDAECRQYFSEMSFMQEIFATDDAPYDPDPPARRVAILLWRFRRSHSGETPTTTWRPLVAQTLCNAQTRSPSELQRVAPDSQSSVLRDQIELEPGHSSVDAQTWASQWADPAYEAQGRLLNPDTLQYQPHLGNTHYYPEPPESLSEGSHASLSSLVYSQSSFATQATPFSSRTSPGQLSFQEGWDSSAIELDHGASGRPSKRPRTIYDFHPPAGSGEQTAVVAGSQEFRLDSAPRIDFTDASLSDRAFQSPDANVTLTDFTGGQILLSLNGNVPPPPLGLVPRIVPSMPLPPAPHPYSEHSPADHDSNDDTPLALAVGLGLQSEILAPQPRHRVSPARLDAGNDSTQPATHPHSPSEAPRQATPELCADGSTLARHHDPNLCADDELLAQLAAASEHLERESREQEQTSDLYDQTSHRDSTITEMLDNELCGDARHLAAGVDGQLAGVAAGEAPVEDAADENGQRPRKGGSRHGSFASGHGNEGHDFAEEDWTMLETQDASLEGDLFGHGMETYGAVGPTEIGQCHARGHEHEQDQEHEHEQGAGAAPGCSSA